MLLTDPHSVFLSPLVSNDSKQSTNSMMKKWSMMSAGPPRTERLHYNVESGRYVGGVVVSDLLNQRSGALMFGN